MFNIVIVSGGAHYKLCSPETLEVIEYESMNDEWFHSFVKTVEITKEFIAVRISEEHSLDFIKSNNIEKIYYKEIK